MNDQALAWALSTLQIQGFSPKGKAEPVRHMPWSDVYRFATAVGDCYCKITRPPLNIETKLLPFLSEKFPDNLPSIIAYNDELNCLLMHDGGEPLRE